MVLLKLRRVVIYGLDGALLESLDEYKNALEACGCSVYNSLGDHSVSGCETIFAHEETGCMSSCTKDTLCLDCHSRWLDECTLQFVECEQTQGFVLLVKGSVASQTARSSDAFVSEWTLGPRVTVQDRSAKVGVDALLAVVVACCAWDGQDDFTLVFQTDTSRHISITESAATLVVDCLGTAFAESAIGALEVLCHRVENRNALIAAGAIPQLVRLLSTTNTEVKTTAAGLLGNMCFNDKNERAIAAAGGILPLVRLLHEKEQAPRQAAAAALRELCYNSENKISIVTAGFLSPIVKMLAYRQEEQEAKINAIEALFNLSEKNFNIQADIARAGAIPPVVVLLTAQMIQGERIRSAVRATAAGVMRNLCRNHQNHASIVDAEAIPQLLKLLGVGSQLNNFGVIPESQTRAAAAFWSLSESVDGRDAVMGVDIIPSLVRLLTVGPLDAKEQAAGALYTLALVEENLEAIEDAGAIPPLTQLQSEGSPQGREAAEKLLRLLLEDDY